MWTVGYAFQSGATEALAYDTLHKKGIEKQWNQVVSTATIIGRISSLICTALGGTLFAIGLRLPYIAASMIGAVGIIAAIYLQEIKIKSTVHKWSMRNYLAQITDGLKTLINPQVLPIAIISLTIISIGYMYNWGILRPLTGERFGFTPTSYAFLLSSTSLTVILSLSLLKWTQKRISLPVHILVMTLMYGVP